MILTCEVHSIQVGPTLGYLEPKEYTPYVGSRKAAYLLGHLFCGDCEVRAFFRLAKREIDCHWLVIKI